MPREAGGVMCPRLNAGNPFGGDRLACVFRISRRDDCRGGSHPKPHGTEGAFHAFRVIAGPTLSSAQGRHPATKRKLPSVRTGNIRAVLRPPCPARLLRVRCHAREPESSIHSAQKYRGRGNTQKTKRSRDRRRFAGRTSRPGRVRAAASACRPGGCGTAWCKVAA